MLQQNPELVRAGSRLTVGALDERRNTVANLQVIDVRNTDEVAEGSMTGASNIPLPRLRGGYHALGSRPPQTTLITRSARRGADIVHQELIGGRSGQRALAPSPPMTTRPLAP